LYTIKWTGLQPTEAGWSPPSDTAGQGLFLADVAAQIWLPYLGSCPRRAIANPQGAMWQNHFGTSIETSVRWLGLSKKEWPSSDARDMRQRIFGERSRFGAVTSEDLEGACSTEARDDI
jgi:hypothetical protein